MTKLAIIDLDGVIADNTKRFEKAEEAKQAFLQEKRNNPQVTEGFSVQKEAANLFWQTAFMAALVVLDTLIEGAIDAMATLAFNGYEVIILTSRPESMYEATRQWLFEQGCPVDLQVIMKPPAAQYVKTVTWKALTVQMLASLFEASEILFVDDEQANRQIVMDSYLDGSINLFVASSLADALEKLKEDEE